LSTILTSSASDSAVIVRIILLRQISADDAPDVAAILLSQRRISFNRRELFARRVVLPYNNL
jgi:hypothetical protein